MKNKYKKGARITDIHHLVSLIEKEKTVYFNDKPVHPGWIVNMSYISLRGSIYRGAWEAIPNA